jgi:hypothetical protein
VAVTKLAVGLPEEDVYENKMARVVTETWECLRKKWLEIKMAQIVTEITEFLRNMCLENKISRLGYLVEVGRRSGNRADW